MTSRTPESSHTAFRFFDAVFDPWMARRLHDVRIRVQDPPAKTGPVLLCLNHVSWWDGFLARKLARRLRPGAPLFTVMLEREIRPRPWLRKLGTIGLEPGSTASLKSVLRQLADVGKRHDDAIVSFFPQGKIWPSTRRPLGFERGIHAANKALGAGVILPVGLHLEPGRHPGPTAYVSSGALVEPGHDGGLEDLERRVEAELNLIQGFVTKYGEDADQHRFESF